MTIAVTLGPTSTHIDADVFELLFDNSTIRLYRDYTKARGSGTITFTKLVELARKADIPYPLFFAPLPVVTAQVDLKTKKLLQGVRKSTFSLNTRATVELSDVELIIKDLVRKQELVKNAKGLFERGNKKVADPQAVIDNLHRKIGQLQVERDFLAGQPAIARLLKGGQ